MGLAVDDLEGRFAERGGVLVEKNGMHSTPTG